MKNALFLPIFQKNLKTALIFRSFGRKIQIAGKFLIKIQQKILIFNNFWKVVAKTRAFGNNIIFLGQFFPFRGEGQTFPMFPMAAPMIFVCGLILNQNMTCFGLN